MITKNIPLRKSIIDLTKEYDAELTIKKMQLAKQILNVKELKERLDTSLKNNTNLESQLKEATDNYRYLEQATSIYTKKENLNINVLEKVNKDIIDLEKNIRILVDIYTQEVASMQNSVELYTTYYENNQRIKLQIYAQQQTAARLEEQIKIELHYKEVELDLERLERYETYGKTTEIENNYAIKIQELTQQLHSAKANIVSLDKDTLSNDRILQKLKSSKAYFSTYKEKRFQNISNMLDELTESVRKFNEQFSFHNPDVSIVEDELKKTQTMLQAKLVVSNTDTSIVQSYLKTEALKPIPNSFNDYRPRTTTTTTTTTTSIPITTTTTTATPTNSNNSTSPTETLSYTIHVRNLTDEITREIPSSDFVTNSTLDNNNIVD